eukprot:6250477-Lingulodinium_polyedra.AAC.1
MSTGPCPGSPRIWRCGASSIHGVRNSSPRRFGPQPLVCVDGPRGTSSMANWMITMASAPPETRPPP